MSSGRVSAAGPDFSGVYGVLVTEQASDLQPNGTPVPGIYLHCQWRLQHTNVKTTSELAATALCYWDAPAYLNPPGGSYPSFLGRADGLAGAPPPPPYGFGELALLAGAYDPGSDTLSLAGCLPADGASGPAVYIDASIAGATLTGSISLWRTQPESVCTSGMPSGAPATAAVELHQKSSGSDLDLDGCLDGDELDATAARRGADPYNPSDCLDPANEDYTGIYTLLATIAAQGVDPDTGAPTPGFYMQCPVRLEDPGPFDAARSVLVRLMCYIDSPALLVNPHVDISPAGPTPGVDAGDGLRGAPPPGFPGMAGAFAEVHASHATAGGSVTVAGADVDLAFTAGICIDNPHSQLGRLYVEAVLNLAANQMAGTADIWVAQPNAGCAGSPAGSAFWAGVPVELVRQGARQPNGALPNIDTDRDHCTDWEELSSIGNAGGLRDPYDWGDFVSVYTGPQNDLAKDRAQGTGDISAVVSRFGSHDSGGTAKINRHTNPKTTPPPAPAYHPSYDRGGSVPNGGSGGVQRQLPSSVGLDSGAVTIGDIRNQVNQFGHSCAGAPN